MIHREYVSATVSGGAWSANTQKLVSGVCVGVYVVPTTATTQYDFTLTDEDGVVVYLADDWIGSLRDLTQFGMRGIYTMAVANSDADEVFKVKLMVEE